MEMHQFRRQFNSDNRRSQDLSVVKADWAIVPGRLMINAAGEAYGEVNFSVRFIQEPYFTYGFQTKNDEPVLAGSLPTGSAHVSEWKTIERLPISVYYTGAHIRIITEGLYQQKIILHFQFAGMALTNPSI